MGDYIVSHYELYKCMVCGKIYKVEEGKFSGIKQIGTADGCCAIGSLIEVKEEK